MMMQSKTATSVGSGYSSRKGVGAAGLGRSSSSLPALRPSNADGRKRLVIRSSSSGGHAGVSRAAAARAAAAASHDAPPAARPSAPSPGARRSHDQIGTLLVQCPDAKGVVARCVFALPQQGTEGEGDLLGWTESSGRESGRRFPFDTPKPELTPSQPNLPKHTPTLGARSLAQLLFGFNCNILQVRKTGGEVGWGRAATAGSTLCAVPAV